MSSLVWVGAAALALVAMWRRQHIRALEALTLTNRRLGPDGIVVGGEGFVLERRGAPAVLLLHGAGDTPGALPMGARLRLKSSKDISGYPPEVRKIFQAMKTYGLIVADNGTNLYVTGTYDKRWDNDVLNPAFASLKASDFEVVQLGWRPRRPQP